MKTFGDKVPYYVKSLKSTCQEIFDKLNHEDRNRVKLKELSLQNLLFKKKYLCQTLSMCSRVISSKNIRINIYIH